MLHQPDQMSPLLARSYLFAPGDRERLVDKALTSGADAVVLDLEDAVSEASKGKALQIVAASLTDGVPNPHTEIWVRINSLDGERWREEVDAIVCASLCGLRVPKACSHDSLQALVERVASVERSRGLPQQSIRVVPTIESALGLSRLHQMAEVERVATFAFGAVDYLADIGAEASDDGRESLHAMSSLVFGCRVANLDQPIAPVYVRYDDDHGLQRSTEGLKRLGFFGRSCIHPRQVPIVQQAFTPRPEEVTRARSVITAYREQAAAGRGSFALQGGEFVDRALVRRAQRVVALAEAISGRWEQ